MRIELAVLIGISLPIQLSLYLVFYQILTSSLRDETDTHSRSAVFLTLTEETILEWTALPKLTRSARRLNLFGNRFTDTRFTSWFILRYTSCTSTPTEASDV